MKRGGEDKARVERGAWNARENIHDERRKKKRKKERKGKKKGKHVSSRKVGILENVKIAYKGMKEE